MTFAPNGFEAYRKPTRRERFLADMGQAAPWEERAAPVKPA
ncbi:MAG TPA: hypothetical protein VNL98_08165 [Gemmatimonadales bacterium]|nr:hypothetical protein [Gemmatimonadales bacterium]